MIVPLLAVATVLLFIPARLPFSHSANVGVLHLRSPDADNLKCAPPLANQKNNGKRPLGRSGALFDGKKCF